MVYDHDRNPNLFKYSLEQAGWLEPKNWHSSIQGPGYEPQREPDTVKIGSAEDLELSTPAVVSLPLQSAGELQILSNDFGAGARQSSLHKRR